MVPISVEPPFPVVQLTDDDGCRHFFRLIRLDSQEGKYVLYDLSRNQNQRRQELVLPEHASPSQAMRETMVVVADTVSHRTMMAQRRWESECRAAAREQRALDTSLYPPDLVGRSLKGWEDAKWALRGIIGSRDDLNPRLHCHGMDAMFLDRRFRDELLRGEAERVGVDKAELKRLFFRWIRFGGDAVALMPRRGGDAPPGAPRTPSDTALRVGRRNAKEIRCGGPRETKGMTAIWRGRMWVVVITIIREASDEGGMVDVERAISHLNNRGYFWEQFRRHFYGDEVCEEEFENRPTEGMVAYHCDRMVRKNEADIRKALLELNGQPESAPIPGGAAVDRNADILETIEMDATEFHQIQIVAVSGKGIRKRLGYATLVLACSRSTAAVVGWFVVIGREIADAYRKCLYWTLCDKTPLLQWLGLDPAKFPGIVSGNGDEVMVDRGPGSAEPMVRYTTESASLDLGVTRPYTAEDKGTVERSNGLIKEKVRAKTGQTKKKLLASKQIEDQIVLKCKALPHGHATMKKAVARQRSTNKRRSIGERPRGGEAALQGSGKIVEMEMREFMRVVVDAVNELNLQELTGELAQSRDMIVEDIERTRAAMHRARQAERFGDAALPVDRQKLATDLLEFSKVKVQHGTIRWNNVWYGVGSEGIGEAYAGVQRLLKDAKAWADCRPGEPFEIEVAFPPDPTRLVALWKRKGEAGEAESQFELLELPATNRSLRTYGHGDGDEVARALHRCTLEARARREKSSPSVVMSSEASAVDDGGEPSLGTGSDSAIKGVGEAARPRAAVDGNVPLGRNAQVAEKYVLPPMDSSGIGGQKYDFDAWLESLRVK